MKMLPLLPNNKQIFSKACIPLGMWAFFVFNAFLFISCGNSLEEIEELSPSDEVLPAATSKNIVLDFSDSAVTKIILKAPLVERFTDKENPYNLMPNGIEIIFMDSLGKVEATVTSNFAEHYPNKNQLILKDDVRVKNKKGEKLNSEHIVWDSRTGKITSDDYVKITTKDEIMYGDGFVSNQDFTEVRIKNIKGIIGIEDEDI